ncbi:MAG: type II secretion system protein GspL [Pseudomonadota bacterium]|nr:type II secretion system protein GspL [Pseudomonadota bacterium]
METLLIRLRDRFSGPDADDVDWIVLDTDQIPLDESRTGTLEECAGHARQRRVVVLAPAEEATLQTVQIVARNRQQLLKAIPYALEENLSQDVDEIHFSVGRKFDADRYPVAITEIGAMDHWVERLKAADLQPAALVPEILALPLAEDEWSMILEPGRALVRTGENDGFACSPESLSVMVDLALQEREEMPSTLRVHRCSGEDAIPDPPLPPEVVPAGDEVCPMPLLASGLDLKYAINLLQGSYQPDSGIGKMVRPWQAAAAILAAWLVVEIGSASLDIARLSHEESALESRIEKVYREAFPDAKRVVNPRVQMQQQLKKLEAAAGGGVGGGFLALIDTGGRALVSEPGIKLDSATYRNARLDMQLSGRDLQSIEGISQHVRKNGYLAEIQSADTSGQTVSARLQLRPGST